MREWKEGWMNKSEYQKMRRWENGQMSKPNKPYKPNKPHLNPRSGTTYALSKAVEYLKQRIGLSKRLYKKALGKSPFIHSYETPSDMDLHLILDNYGTHKHLNVKRWLAKHKRFQLHFTPTSSSWLNLIERWFVEITRKRIRRGVFRSVPDLIAAIEEFIRINNDNPKPFVWTKKVEQIMEKVNRCKAIIETLH